MNDDMDEDLDPTDNPIDANCLRFSTAAATARFIASSLECCLDTKTVDVGARGGDEISY